MKKARHRSNFYMPAEKLAKTMLRSIEAVKRCGAERRSVRAANREHESVSGGVKAPKPTASHESETRLSLPLFSG